MSWSTLLLISGAVAWLCLAAWVWCIIRTGTVADHRVLHYYRSDPNHLPAYRQEGPDIRLAGRCDPAETDAVIICSQIRTLAARADAGAVFAAAVGNALTVPAEATRATLLRELDKWAKGQLTN